MNSAQSGASRKTLIGAIVFLPTALAITDFTVSRAMQRAEARIDAKIRFTQPQFLWHLIR